MGDTSDIASAVAENSVRYRKSLRNANINYRSGWFFVTVQVRHNKSIFGAVVGESVELNGFGRAVWEYWLGLPAKYPELEVFESVLMPNHFHALIRIHFRESNKPNHLGFLMSRFKGGTSFLYGKARRAGEVEDIGEHLWQLDYWDDLVTSDEEFEAIARYIRENPKHWSRDRYGACTSYSFGNLELMNEPRIAFVASQGFYASELRPRKIWAKGRLKPPAPMETAGGRIAPPAPMETAGGRIAPPAPMETAGGRIAPLVPMETAGGRIAPLAPMGAVGRISVAGGGSAAGVGLALGVGLAAGGISAAGGGSAAGVSSSGQAASAAANSPVLISTFTSAQEREALRRALAKGKRVIQVTPQGLPLESDMSPELLAACREGRALLLSPQSTGSRLNKKVATWCNEYVLRHAEEIWVGDLSPNGMLATMLGGLHRELAGEVPY